MENEIMFSESQKFRQWWLWLLVLLSDGILIAVAFVVLSTPEFAGKPIRTIITASVAVFAMVPAIIFMKLRLDTQIKKSGVYVRFFPFQLSFKEYKWENISKSFVREYNPIGEYGGWGVRFGFAGKALNVSGNKGLQLEFNDKKKLLIGTNKPEELTEVLVSIGRLIE